MSIRLPSPSLTLATLALVAAVGCARSREGVREWRPEDHDHADGPSDGAARPRARAATSAASPDAPRPSAGPAAPPSLAEAAWRAQCAVCHGIGGQGDGPQGPMVRAPDLTRRDWQARTSDAEIAAVISAGRGKMPAFQLPPETVQGLVRKIRSLGGR